MATEYQKAVERGLEGLRYVSVGVCPGCERCRDELAEDMTMPEFAEAWSSGEVEYFADFDSCSCGICGSSLGGNRHVWHWVDDQDEIQHEDDACTDCVMYLANGDEPEEWRRTA